MQELSINRDQAKEALALTPDRKKIIEKKVQEALLQVLIQSGGEIIRLKPPQKGKTGGNPSL